MLEERMAAFMRLQKNKVTLENGLPHDNLEPNIAEVILAVAEKLTALQQPNEIARIIASHVQELGYMDYDSHTLQVYKTLKQYLWSGEKEAALAVAVWNSLQPEEV